MGLTGSITSAIARLAGVATVAAIVIGGSLVALPATAQAAPQTCRATTPTSPTTYCTVTNTSTGMLVEVLGHSTAADAPTLLWPNHGGISEQFMWRYSVELTAGEQARTYLLVARHSGMCLTATGSRFADGGAVLQQPCSVNGAQGWKLREIPRTAADCPSGQCFAGSRFVLENVWNRRCLDAANAAFPAPPRQGAGLATWPCITTFGARNAVNQDWSLQSVDQAPGPIVN